MEPDADSADCWTTSNSPRTGIIDPALLSTHGNFARPLRNSGARPDRPFGVGTVSNVFGEPHHRSESARSSSARGLALSHPGEGHLCLASQAARAIRPSGIWHLRGY